AVDVCRAAARPATHADAPAARRTGAGAGPDARRAGDAARGRRGVQSRAPSLRVGEAGDLDLSARERAREVRRSLRTAAGRAAVIEHDAPVAVAFTAPHRSEAANAFALGIEHRAAGECEFAAVQH